MRRSWTKRLSQTGAFLPIGYLFSILIETPVLLVGLSPRHPFTRKLFAGIWLTACTYPIVILVLPEVFNPDKQRALYLCVAETFAPVAECLLFCLAFWEWTPGKGLQTITAKNWAQGLGPLAPPGPEEPSTAIAARPTGITLAHPGAISAGVTGSQVPEAPGGGAGRSGLGDLVRDVIAITMANLGSFGVGEVIYRWISG